MVLTSDCFHFMVHLLIFEECFFIILMFDVLFDYVFF